MKVLMQEEGKEGGTGGAPPKAPESGNPPPTQESGIPKDALPEWLRDKSPEQIRGAFDRMVNLATDADKRAKKLEQEIKSLQNSGTTTANIGGESGGTKKPKGGSKGKELSDLIFENPEEALEQWASERYGKRFEQIEDQVVSTTFANLRNQLADFQEFESDIREILNSSGLPKTEEAIRQTYTLLVGRKTLEDREKQRKAMESLERSQPTEEESSEPELSELEQEIARSMGISSEDYNKYKGNNFDIKVPS